MTLRPASSRALLAAATAAALAGCTPDYSPNTYSSNAVQQANKVEQGVIVGVRDVDVSANPTAGAVVGGAAGGIAGAQVGTGPISAFSALGGSLIGGLAGTAAEHATGDTKAFEYIVRKSAGDLVSVTQKDTTPLAIGERVLVIAGSQARVVPDYTVNLTPGPKEKAAAAKPAGEPKPTPTEAPGDAPKPDAAKTEAPPASPAAAATPPAAGQAPEPVKPDTPTADAAPAGGTAAFPLPPASGSRPNDPVDVPASAAPAEASEPPSPAPEASAPSAGAPIRLTDPLPAPAPSPGPDGSGKTEP